MVRFCWCSIQYGLGHQHTMMQRFWRSELNRSNRRYIKHDTFIIFNFYVMSTKQPTWFVENVLHSSRKGQVPSLTCLPFAKKPILLTSLRFTKDISNGIKPILGPNIFQIVFSVIDPQGSPTLLTIVNVSRGVSGLLVVCLVLNWCDQDR